MRRRWGFRGWAVMWAVLQFALPAAATLADARLERQSVGAQAHVESRSEATCRPIHPSECALCQLVLRVAGAAAGQASVVAVVRVAARPPIANRAWEALAHPTGSLLARAPPVG
jgi:hypothetical protein